jgi:hypothetical protein
MWIFITPHEHVMYIKNNVSSTSSPASSVNKITLKILLALYIFTKRYSLHLISWLHGLVLFVRGKDQDLVLLKYARLQGVKLLHVVLVFAYLFQVLFRLLLLVESVVQHSVPTCWGTLGVCHDLPFLNRTFLCLSIVAP